MRASAAGVRTPDSSAVPITAVLNVDCFIFYPRFYQVDSPATDRFLSEQFAVKAVHVVDKPFHVEALARYNHRVGADSQRLFRIAEQIDNGVGDFLSLTRQDQIGRAHV